MAGTLECLFCKIIRKEVPATFLYEDEEILAFLDIHPVNVGHTLLIPKTHFENIFDLDPKTLESLARASQKIARAVQGALSANGVNIISNNGGAAGQIIFHAHTHIIPRFLKDGFSHWKGKTFSPEEISEAGEKIRNALSSEV